MHISDTVQIKKFTPSLFATLCLVGKIYSLMNLHSMPQKGTPHFPRVPLPPPLPHQSSAEGSPPISTWSCLRFLPVKRQCFLANVGQARGFCEANSVTDAI